MVAAQTLADVTAAYLLNAQGRQDARLAAERFQHAALHDALTGLSNPALPRAPRHAAQRARGSHCAGGVIYIDLDHIKHVNDTRGHHIGDQLLIAVARRLGRLMRSGDTLARVSGDEFVFFREDLHSDDDIDIRHRTHRCGVRRPVRPAR